MTQETYPLPEAFRQRMLRQLGAEAECYFAALEAPYLRGLRLNPRKPLAQPERWVEGLEKPVPWWAPDGFYLARTSSAGVSPLHEAGAFYIQEPSAMAPVKVLSPKPGERVLDLCAAPGGKSTQIADGLQGRGLLVCNEPVLARARILSRNLERMGVTNGLVVSAEPEKLAPLWENLFDAVLVDAPCSGEGMFRRHPETRAEWTPQAPEGCAARQKRILAAAWQMLRPGGRLVYSTCTLNREENEQAIAWLLKEKPDAETAAFILPVGEGKTLDAPEGTLHLYPHQVEGEGHFVALVKKRGNEIPRPLIAAGQVLTPPKRELTAAYALWESETGASLPPPNAQWGETLLCAPSLPPVQGIQVLRAGWQLGTLKGKLFFPDHALAMGLPTPYRLPLWEIDEESAKAYQRGETLATPPQLRGFYLVTYHGLALGFGKASQGQMKNHYPKGLRRP